MSFLGNIQLTFAFKATIHCIYFSKILLGLQLYYTYHSINQYYTYHTETQPLLYICYGSGSREPTLPQSRTKWFEFQVLMLKLEQ